jgi:cullin-4
MQAELTAYTKYYKLKHSGHVLEWDHALGTATMKARFNAGWKELSLSLYQAVVLLLFNQSLELSYKEILEQTRMGGSPLSLNRSAFLSFSRHITTDHRADDY